MILRLHVLVELLEPELDARSRSTEMIVAQVCLVFARLKLAFRSPRKPGIIVEVHQQEVQVVGHGSHGLNASDSHMVVARRIRETLTCLLQVDKAVNQVLKGFLFEQRT